MSEDSGPTPIAHPLRAWDTLRERLEARLTMARQVLDAEGFTNVAALVPIEEVLIWMGEIDGSGSGGGGVMDA